MKIIVIGSGGREHAMAWTLSKSPDVSEIVVIPGNGGTAIEDKCKNIPVPVSDISTLVSTCVSELAHAPEGSFVVIGPEDPLAAALADKLIAAGLPVVGPCQRGAELEASKDIAKHFMAKYGVACPSSKTFTDYVEAIAEIDRIAGPVVVKADGLAAGKGVVVAGDRETAVRAIHDFMVESTLGPAGRKVVIEEYLEGEEISILAAVSVTPELASKGLATIVPFVTARDHKRLRDGALGPNTGGMGAIAPVPSLEDDVLPRFQSDILEPTLAGLIAEGFDYRGFIFFGLMLTKEGPKLLEYNVRLGDPETQAVLPLMDFDFSKMCASIIDGSLSSFPFSWKRGYVCAPVMVSGGYPGNFSKGLPISIDTTAVAVTGSKIFIAGAAQNQRSGSPRVGDPIVSGSGLVTSGGRVLCASGFGLDIESARTCAYQALEAVVFEGSFHRKDIGLPGAASSKSL